MALFLHLLHSPSPLSHPLRLLGQVQVQHRHPPSLDIGLSQRVHHQHHPHRTLPLPVASNGVEEVVGVESLPSLIRSHPRGHHELHVLQVSLEPAVDVPRQDVLQVLALGEELAAGQGRDGIRVGQVQLKVDDVALLEGLLGVLSDEVPDARVRDVDRAVEIRGRVPLDGPQEGVQLGLLEGQEEMFLV